MPLFEGHHNPARGGGGKGFLSPVLFAQSTWMSGGDGKRGSGVDASRPAPTKQV
jgi:hypothetical protein